jgi:hypothetical protein
MTTFIHLVGAGVLLAILSSAIGIGIWALIRLGLAFAPSTSMMHDPVD